MTMSETGSRQEALRQEHLTITPESLVRDNHSSIAQERRTRWSEAKISGDLIAYFRCSDARVQPTGLEAMSLGSIAAAFKNPEALKPIINRNIKAAVVLAHIDGETVRPGEMPTGCGGLAAKEGIGNSIQEEGTGKFISEVVGDKDPVVQSIWTAQQIAVVSGKPTLAAIQDHRDHSIHPVGYFQVKDGQLNSVTSPTITEHNIRHYDPKQIYSEGLPEIAEASLPDVLKELLEQNRKERRDELSKYPNIAAMQKVQRPRMVWLTTDPSSLRQKVPEISSVPGSIFKVHAIRGRANNGVSFIDPEMMESYLGELQYPLEHSIENHHDANLPFSNTDRLIIETGRLEVSMDIASKAMGKEWMRQWASLPERKIIILQTNDGVINAAEYFQTT